MLRLLCLVAVLFPAVAFAADIDVPFLGAWEALPAALEHTSHGMQSSRIIRAFVATHVHPDVQLRDVTVVDTPRGQVVRQVQTVDGIEVDGISTVSQVQGSTLRYAHVRVVTPERLRAVPKVDAEAAREAVAQFAPGAGIDAASLRWRSSASGLLLVWRVPFTLATPPGSWAADVDATNGVVIARRSLDVHATDDIADSDTWQAEVLAPVERRCVGDTAQSTPLKYVEWSQGRNADAQGVFHFGSTDAEAHVSLESPYINIVDKKAPLSGPWTMPLVAKAHNTLSLTQVAPAHADTYYALHEARDWLAGRSELTGSQRDWADTQVRVNLNLDGHCNAFYSTYQESLNFFPAGHGCIDSARSTQALFHEYGHALQFHSTPDGYWDVTQALGEGYGDVVATFVSKKGVVGDIKPDCDTVLRTCENTLTFCKKGCDFKGWRHAYESAQVVCGAWWDLRSRLMARYGEHVGAEVAADLFVRHLPLVNGDMPDTYAALIAADDDDDGNVRNGTQHSCEINAAYAGKPARFPDLQSILVPCAPRR